MKRILIPCLLALFFGTGRCEDTPPGPEPPSWFVLRLGREKAELAFEAYAGNPAHLPRDCRYGGKAEVRELLTLEGRTFARIEYRLLCLVIGPHPDGFRRRRLTGQGDDYRWLQETYLFRPRTVTGIFRFEWDGRDWKVAGPEPDEDRFRERPGEARTSD